MSDTAAVRIEPWGKGDRPLLDKLHGDPAMMDHLGGPETPEKLAERQQRYETAESGIFRVVEVRTGEPVGLVLYWERVWRQEGVYEVGWFVLPSFQGRGIASAATAQAIGKARDEGRHRFMHAFPAIAN